MWDLAWWQWFTGVAGVLAVWWWGFSPLAISRFVRESIPETWSDKDEALHIRLGLCFIWLIIPLLSIWVWWFVFRIFVFSNLWMSFGAIAYCSLLYYFLVRRLNRRAA